MTDETVEDDATAPDDAGDHLADVPHGAGCAEIWDHFSAERDDE